MAGQMEIMLILVGIVGLLALLVERTGLPFPLMMVIGGVVVALIPGLPVVTMDPDLVLMVFLPPLIYSAAFFFPWREFQQNLVPILMMAIGLVLVTMVCVAFVSNWLIPAFTLASAFVLGAVVSPPDAIAANAVLHRLHVPRRLVTVLEGESLVNDASALVAYSFAVAAVTTGTFSFQQAVGAFFLDAIGGLACGIAAGWCVSRLHEKIREPGTGMTLELLAPYMAFVPAEHFGLSGVLGAVAAGLFVGSRANVILNPETRLQSETIWGFINYFLNGIVFILIGLEFPEIMKDLETYDGWALALYATVVSAVVIAVRFAWILGMPFVFSRIFPGAIKRKQFKNGVLIVASWAGMRGAVSLAAALAIPRITESGADFPGRELILFITYCVIFTTLVLPVLTLPHLVKALKVEVRTSNASNQELKARMKILDEIIEMIDNESTRNRENPPRHSLEAIRDYYQTRYDHLRRVADDEDSDKRDPGAEIDLIREYGAYARRRLEEFRDEGLIDEPTRRQVVREIDSEEDRLEKVFKRRRASI